MQPRASTPQALRIARVSGTTQTIEMDARVTPVTMSDPDGARIYVSNAFGYVAPTGRLVYVGITTSEIVFPHAPVFHRRELTLLASRNALPADFPAHPVHGFTEDPAVRAGEVDQFKDTAADRPAAQAGQGGLDHVVRG